MLYMPFEGTFSEERKELPKDLERTMDEEQRKVD